MARQGKAVALQLFQFEFMMRFNLCRRQASIEMMKMENSKMISQGMDKEALFTYGCVPASDNSAPSHRIHRQGTAGLWFGWALSTFMAQLVVAVIIDGQPTSGIHWRKIHWH